MALKVIKRYRVQDLEPGMVLGRTLLNEKGQVILDQGKVILQEGTLITRELIREFWDNLIDNSASFFEIDRESGFMLSLRAVLQNHELKLEKLFVNQSLVSMCCKFA